MILTTCGIVRICMPEGGNGDRCWQAIKTLHALSGKATSLNLMISMNHIITAWIFQYHVTSAIVAINQGIN